MPDARMRHLIPCQPACVPYPNPQRLNIDALSEAPALAPELGAASDAGPKNSFVIGVGLPAPPAPAAPLPPAPVDEERPPPEGAIVTGELFALRPRLEKMPSSPLPPPPPAPELLNLNGGAAVLLLYGSVAEPPPPCSYCAVRGREGGKNVGSARRH